MATVGKRIIGRQPFQVVVPSLQFLQVLIVDQPLVPEVLEKTKVGSTCLQSLASDGVYVSNMVHPHVPGHPPVVAMVSEVA